LSPLIGYWLSAIGYFIRALGENDGAR
jgi:hypothetical protein